MKSVSTLTLNVLATCATIGLAALVARQEGLMGPTVGRRGARLIEVHHLTHHVW